MPRSHIAVEARVRHLLATHLGVDPGALRPDAKLQLDVVARREVKRLLERTFAVALDDPDVARQESCRDLSTLIERRVAERDRPGLDWAPMPAWVRVIPSDPSCPVLERLVELTPYMVETVVEDARVPGRYRRLEVILGPGEPQGTLERVERLFARARATGLPVEVHRGPAARAARATPRRRSRP